MQKGIKAFKCCITCFQIFGWEVQNKSVPFIFLSHFHNCNIIWHNCDTENTIKIEKIQKRALRVILNVYQSSYDELLDKIDQPLIYKYNLWGGIPLDQLKVCTKRYGIHTIRYQGARLWNSLHPTWKRRSRSKTLNTILLNGMDQHVNVDTVCHVNCLKSDISIHWAIGYNVCFYEYFEAHWIGFYKSGN